MMWRDSSTAVPTRIEAKVPDQNVISDTIQELLQGAAADALSSFCDANDDDWRDAADQVRDAVVAALSDAGFEIVRPAYDVQPRTVHIGHACDQYEATLRKGHNKRVMVVEKSDA